MGAVIKYGTDRGGRDSKGSPNLLKGKCWVSKVFHTAKMGH